MSYPEVNLELAKELGLQEDEYQRILDLLGRTPTYTELGIFSVMWSEHCSYKNSIKQLKTLPREGGKLLVGAGEENAGLIDIGDGLAVAFKIESHNHPSAVEPYQGAATGVGGILRDIFTMGARPIAALNSLRFGKILPNGNSSEKEIDRTKYLFSHVVKGIGDYGNCFGVPTVSGEVYFEQCYQDNPLVNAMAVGIVKHNQTATATAMGTGNPVFIVGSSTGKDGIHGATFASEEISEKSESKRPSVQVGDPFTEKLLVEATLEAIQSGVVVGIQDMGAAGITCSTSEMSAKGKCGMKIDLDNVPLRDETMTAYEIMLSESQERMLVVVEKGKEKEAIDIFEKWDLNCLQIGEVIDEDRVKVYHRGELEADVPADALVLGGGAPVYTREQKEPEYLKDTRSFDPNTISEPSDYNDTLLKLLTSPNIANKTWVYKQYDYEVRTNTVIVPGGDASVVRIKGTNKGLAMKVDCNSKFVYLNPYMGGITAVSECARNVVCTGGKPLGITNCLNFGNPYDPEVYYQFAEAIRGIGDACRKFDTPVTGGNVSFYNESQDFAVYPTPTIGIIGLIEDINKMMTSNFKKEGDVILLIGKQNCNEIGGSEYLNFIHHKVTGDSPQIDLDEEKALQDCTLELIEKGLINSAHDTSEGGIAVALTEACIMDKKNLLGCNVRIDFANRKDFELFGEAQSRIIITADKDKIDEIISICENNGVPVKEIGTVTGKDIKINDDISISTDEASQKYYKMFDELMQN
ncbi:MAG: phosphoribosylformylglycinamidine synthase subunit PurL [Ignavibacteriae bacterium]|nr:phosphoribosylformylglycinamidine synthase subunit PurL [Ignavibacteriota bacterium]MCB9243283.1 phosphoribosylformylglycinamidine synthase subunit PurL [Ignavibacteriales bacterium]